MKAPTSEREESEKKKKMAKGKNSSQGSKRVDAVDSRSSSVLVRAKDGSAFTKCDECEKDVPVALISMHSCSLEAKIKMNLEAQVVEQPSQAKKSERKRSKSSEPKAKRSKVEKTKKEKDPNKPKRPPTAFFVFMDDFRKTFKEANPDSKDVKRVGKEGGEKWRSMTDEEKKPYLDKAAELKAEYGKAMESYNAAEAEGEEGGEDGEGEHEEGADDKSDKEEAAAGEEEELTDEE
ncbi:hypothetical protein PIB30_117842 [Stylosanthes scabra]|uniref:HMG box domain-containing protein n=1 Tax=Stylosanthes scabra TaxID=79078 RepID=A0ABU6QH52_9FABA|nr:hypothetical protein [Stylosanthes scabra]